MPKCPYCFESIDVSIVKALSAEEIQAQLNAVDASRLTGDALDFYNNTVARIKQYGDKTRLTVPQRKWLKDLTGLYPAKTPELPLESEAQDEF